MLAANGRLQRAELEAHQLLFLHCVKRLAHRHALDQRGATAPGLIEAPPNRRFLASLVPCHLLGIRLAHLCATPRRAARRARRRFAAALAERLAVHATPLARQHHEPPVLSDGPQRPRHAGLHQLASALLLFDERRARRSHHCARRYRHARSAVRLAGVHHHQARPGNWHPGIVAAVRLDCHCIGHAAHSARPIHHGHCHPCPPAVPGQLCVLLATSRCLRPQLHSYAQSTDDRHFSVLSYLYFCH